MRPHSAAIVPKRATMPIPLTDHEAELEMFYAFDSASLGQMKRSQSAALSMQLEHFWGDGDGAPEYGDPIRPPKGSRGGARHVARPSRPKLLRPSPSGWFTPLQQEGDSSHPCLGRNSTSFASQRQQGRSAPQLMPRSVCATPPPASCAAASGMAPFGVLSNYAVEMAYQLAHAYQVPVELPVPLRPPSRDGPAGGSAASLHADGFHEERMMPARPQSPAQWRGFQQQEMERWLARQGVPEWHIARAMSPRTL